VNTRTELVIVRSGESWPNLVNPRSASASTVGLTAQGTVQAQRIAQSLALEAKTHGEFAALYLSPRRRALETAAPIGRTLGLDGVVAQELRSLDHGPGDPWDPRRNTLATLPPLAPRAAVLAGCESWEAYLRRTGRCLADLAERHRGSRVVIVGHAGTQTGAMTGFLRLPVTAGTWCRAQVDHGGICRWSHEHPQLRGADRDGCWTLLAHNETAHLHPADQAAVR
jgi:probable phosphoglycerate mutase